jgi:hypothetical protein
MGMMQIKKRVLLHTSRTRLCGYSKPSISACIQWLLQTIEILRSIKDTVGLAILHSREKSTRETSCSFLLDRQSLCCDRNVEFPVCHTGLRLRRTWLTVSRDPVTEVRLMLFMKWINRMLNGESRIEMSMHSRIYHFTRKGEEGLYTNRP